MTSQEQVVRKEVEKMAYFGEYLKWCKEKGLKPNQADNLHRFISQLTKA